MSNLLFMKNYNNYFNRIVKRDVDFYNYNYVLQQNLNFNPNDDVSTQHIINWNQDWTPDYMFIIDGVAINPEYMVNNFHGVEVLDSFSTVVFDEDKSWLIQEGYLVNKTLDIQALADMDQGSEYVNILGEWETDNFGFKMNSQFDAITIEELYDGTGDTIVIQPADLLDTDGYVNKDVLVAKGWDLNTTIRKIEIYGSHELFDNTVVLLPQENIGTILSRWFVTESVRTRQGQYKFTLKRDLIADYYDKIISAPMIIDRAWITNPSNPLIYNSEGFTFNQIKTEEIPLRDQGRTQWYVLYFKSTVDADNHNFTNTITRPDFAYDMIINNFNLQSGDYYMTTNVDIHLNYNINLYGDVYNIYKLNILNSGVANEFIQFGRNMNYLYFQTNGNTVLNTLPSAFSGQYNQLKTKLLADLSDASVNQTTYNLYKSYNGKIILDQTNNKVYKVTVEETNSIVSNYQSSGTFSTEMKAIVDATGLNYQTWTNQTSSYDISRSNLAITVEDITADYSYVWELDFGTKVNTLDSEFAIIAIPYETMRLAAPNLISCIADNNINEALVKSIIETCGEACVDAQLLPYCPIQKAVGQTGYGNTLLARDLDTKSYDILGTPSTDLKTSCILYVQYSNFTFDIQQTISGGSTALDKKINNECNMYKIVSPNYNGSFEFSPSKNNGVSYFNVDVSLIPYTPYIHVNPVFKGLYGQDFNDSRGLICNGDFSLPRRQDQWANYKLNNKNYQEIFDRQMRHMEFTQRQERINAYVGLGVGTAGGVATGMAGGAMLGGPIGATIGGAVGGIGSLAGGIVDAAMLDSRQEEERSYAIDNYKFQLGNIQAMPDNISKVTPFNYNYKKFPFVEVYKCSDIERSLFTDFLNYRSMTVNAIGTIEAYITSTKHFLQGKLLRLEELGLAYHEAYEIYNELKKGVYI